MGNMLQGVQYYLTELRNVRFTAICQIPTMSEYTNRIDGIDQRFNISKNRVDCGLQIVEWLKRCHEPWVRFPTVGLKTLLTFTCLPPITMAPYARWVLESFKHILVDSCDEYFDTNDRGNDKSRSKLITRVANDIAAIAQDKKEHVPDDLEKVKCLSITNIKY